MLKKLIPSIATIALCGTAMASESYSSFDLGTTFFTFRGQEDSLNASVEDSGVFCGARGEAAYTIKGLVYGSLMGVYAPGASTTTHNVFGLTKDGSATTIKIGTSLWQAEAKIGKHQPMTDKFSVVPFLSFGIYNIYSSINLNEVAADGTTEIPAIESTAKMQWMYGAGGLMGNWYLSKNFEVGFSAKLIRHVYVKNDKTYNGMTMSSTPANGWGYEVSLPIKAITTDKAWCMAVDPFFLKMDTSQTVNVFGARVSLQKGF